MPTEEARKAKIQRLFEELRASYTTRQVISTTGMCSSMNDTWAATYIDGGALRFKEVEYIATCVVGYVIRAGQTSTVKGSRDKPFVEAVHEVNKIPGSTSNDTKVDVLGEIEILHLPVILKKGKLVTVGLDPGYLGIVKWEQDEYEGTAPGKAIARKKFKKAIEERQKVIKRSNTSTPETATDKRMELLMGEDSEE